MPAASPSSTTARDDVEAAVAGYVFARRPLVPVVDWNRVPRRLRMPAQKARGGLRDGSRLPMAALVITLVCVPLMTASENPFLTWVTAVLVASGLGMGLRGCVLPRRWAGRVVRRYAAVEYVDPAVTPELAALVSVAKDQAADLQVVARRAQRRGDAADTARMAAVAAAEVERSVLVARALPATHHPSVVENLTVLLTAMRRRTVDLQGDVDRRQHTRLNSASRSTPKPGRSR